MSEEKVKIDLHCHTTASDGICTPAQLIEKAKSENVSAVAIADHDTVDAIDSALEAGRALQIRVIPAIEFSVDYPGGDFHLLGYFIDHNEPVLRQKTERIMMIREKRIPLIVTGLREAGIDITEEDVLAESSGSAMGKPHVARALVKKGIVKNFDEAFELYLSHGKPGDIPKDKITAEKALSYITGAGGIPVCAHPVSLGLPYGEVYSILHKLMPLGLKGIECYSNMHSDDDVREYSAIARSLSLAITGGSDYHGDKGEALGEYGQGRIIPESCLAGLDALRR